MDMDRLADRALEARKKLQAQQEATQLDATRQAVDDFRDEIHRKVVAYTTVADMSPEQFRSLIEGNWKKTRSSGDISQLTPDDISQRVRRWAEMESNMTDDISQPNSTTLTDYISQQAQQAEMRRRAIYGDDDDPNVFARIGDDYQPPSIPTQLREIGKSLFRVARAWVKGLP